jgi:hypothetical protein
MKEVIKFLVRFVPFLQTYPHGVQWAFFVWLFLTLGVAAMLFFTPRVKESSTQSQIVPDPPKSATTSSPVLPDPDQVASLIAVLKERAEGIRINLDHVIERVALLHKDDATSQLKDLKARFLVLHERHIAAIPAYAGQPTRCMWASSRLKWVRA